MAGGAWRDAGLSSVTTTTPLLEAVRVARAVEERPTNNRCSLSVCPMSVCLLFVHPYSTLHAAVLHAPNTTPVPQFQAIAHGRHSKRAGERVRKPGQASHPRRCCSHASTCPARRLTPTWRTDESRRRWRPGWFSKVGVENAPGRGTVGEGRMGIWMDGWMDGRQQHGGGRGCVRWWWVVAPSTWTGLGGGGFRDRNHSSSSSTTQQHARTQAR